MYEATDGSRWDNERLAIARDMLHKMAVEAERPLGKRPNLNSEEYFQHSAENYDEARRDYETLATAHCGSLNPRVVTDSDDPVSKLCHRFLAIDSQGREWQQPYFVANTPKNPKRVNL